MSEPVMSQDALVEFRQRVLADAELQAQLWRATERDAFIELCVRLGAAHGYSFTREEVLTALRAGKRPWRAEWV
jgi:hypothetical protein